MALKGARPLCERCADVIETLGRPVEKHDARNVVIVTCKCGQWVIAGGPTVRSISAPIDLPGHDHNDELPPMYLEALDEFVEQISETPKP